MKDTQHGRSADWQSAVSPTGSRQALRIHEGLRFLLSRIAIGLQVANLRHSRVPLCATEAVQRGRSADWQSAVSPTGSWQALRKGRVLPVQLQRQVWIWLLPGILFLGIVRGVSAPALSVNGVGADYTTTHLFVDEVAGDSIPLTVLFSPNTNNVVEAEVFSNLNRRGHATLDADGDGIEDGILPPNGNQIADGDDSHYYRAYNMTSLGNGQYAVTLHATNCGAYRLTARYKVAGDTNWRWYSSEGSAWRANTAGRRDHSLVVSPKKAQTLVLYEVNASIVDARGAQTSQRSTLVDLYDGPGSWPYNPVTNRFNLDYVGNLGVNWLWLQPIHPIGIDSGVNSPYCVKNFFAVSPLLSKANTRPAAMQEFKGFVAAADAADINVMLDIPFNHTARDCELDVKGVSYFAGAGNPGAWQPADQIRNREPRLYSSSNQYNQRASSAANVAAAPDRGDFGKWGDVADVFYGVYPALVAKNPQNNNNYRSQADTFDYSTSTNSGSFDQVTHNVWRYFSDVLLHWLDQTGCTNGLPASETAAGIDGIRADFAEGLPPPAWEFIINKTRARKWDFVFLAESLGPTSVTYRSSRNFDVIFDNVLHDFRNATTAIDYRSIFESRRNTYGQCSIVWSSASHDVGGHYTDPFQALIRFLVAATMDGAPMIFYGQELGTIKGFGFSVYQNNSERTPQFLGLNSLQPIFAPTNRTHSLDQLYSIFAAAGRARQISPALRSSNRRYLDTIGTSQPAMFAVAKVETANASPNMADVLFAFVNLDPTNSHQGNFNLNIVENGSNLFGIKSSRMYNVKNIGAYTSADPDRTNLWLWGGGVVGSNLLTNGVSVQVNPVPANNATWATSPFEAQYLKLFDVTPPSAAAAPGTVKPYAIGDAAIFSWPVLVDPDGGVSGYHICVGTLPGGSNVLDVITTNTSITVSHVEGSTLFAKVSAINQAGIEGASSHNSIGVILLDPDGDQDGDGMTNMAEDRAETDPLDAGSFLQVLGLANGNRLTWSSVSDNAYQIEVATNLESGFTAISGPIIATGTTASYLDTAATDSHRFYRVKLVRE